MRRPRQQIQQRIPDQRLQRTPEQTQENTPDQTQERTPEQTLRWTPDQTRQQTPLILQHTPHQTPQQSPRQTPEPNMQNESSSANVDLWEVGSMHSDGHQQVEVIKGMLVPSGKCSNKTRGIMYERLEPRGFTWKEVSKETKAFYFEEFKKWFVWRQPDNVVYTAWLKSTARRYTDLRCKARRDWESGKLNNRIGQAVWLSWIEDWKTPEFQTKSITKKLNRKGGVEDDGPYPGTHTSGSASHRLLATRLARIASLRAERSQPIDGSLVPQNIDENKLYYDVVGGRNERNRIYGLGSTQNIFYEPSCSDISQFNSFQPNTRDYHKLEAELHEMKERMIQMDEMQQQMMNQLAMMSNNQN